MTDDDLDARASLHACLSGPVGAGQPAPTTGALRELIALTLRLREGDRMASRIKLDEGGSIGWTPIATIAEQNGIA